MNNLVTQKTMDLMKAAMQNRMMSDRNGNLLMQKALTSAASDLNWYDLQAPSRLLVPWVTPLRNKLSRMQRTNPGDAVRYKQIRSIANPGYTTSFVPEGQRSGVINYAATDIVVPYHTFGLEGALTFELEAAAQGLEDENSRLSFILMEQVMVSEEIALLGANNSVALGTPSTPTAASTGTGATITTATYSVIVVALTLEGYLNSSVSGGVATQRVILGQDGKSYTTNGGSSMKSANVTQSVTNPAPLTAATAVLNGAVAYAWYVGAAGSETLQAITTINSVNFLSLTTTGQPIQQITQDCSQNNGSTGGGTNQTASFDGIMSVAYNNQLTSNAYYVAQATGTSGTGTPLTADGVGGIVEFNTAFKKMWDLYRLGPTVIWVNSQEANNIRLKCLNSSSAPLLRINQSADGDEYQVTAGGTIAFIYNIFDTNGGYKVPVKIHPNLPPGTIVMYAENLPAYYKDPSTPVVAAVQTQRDYYRIDWPLRTRQREYGVYAQETLAVYAPFATAIITNVGNG